MYECSDEVLEVLLDTSLEDSVHQQKCGTNL